jgi:molybdopterin-guanine dinucleotide biosynthesis protein A
MDKLKHVKLNKITREHFHANEMAIWGIGCTALKNLVHQLSNENSTLNYGFADFLHQDEVAAADKTTCNDGQYELKKSQLVKRFQTVQFFNENSFVLINGNHITSKNMILWLDGIKVFKPNEEKLKHTKYIFYNENTAPIALEIAKLNTSQKVELINGTNVSVLAELISKSIRSNISGMIGLVLAGGKSERMQQNKNLITYHGIPQVNFTEKLLQKYCTDVFISVGNDAAPPDNLIADTFLNLGPLSGILSAFKRHPDKAILVLASDMPLMNESAVEYLVSQRDSELYATVYYNATTDFLEPLAAIYEPRMYSAMLQLLSEGISCPSKILKQLNIKIIESKNPVTLMNANTPEQKLIAEKLIEQSK